VACRPPSGASGSARVADTSERDRGGAWRRKNASGWRRNASGCPENRSGCRIRPVRQAAGRMPAGGVARARPPDTTEAPAGRAPWSSSAMSPIGAHRTPAPLPRAPTSTPRPGTPTLPPPAPPAAAGRRHRFPRSHGPSEQKVNEQWLTFRCHETPAPGSAPAGPRPARSRIPKEPETRRNPGESASAGPPGMPDRAARRRIRHAHASRRRPMRPDADRKNRRNPRAAGILENRRHR